LPVFVQTAAAKYEMTPSVKRIYDGVESESGMNDVLCPSYLRDSQLPLQRAGGISESKSSRPTSDYSEAFEPSNTGRARPCWRG